MKKLAAGIDIGGGSTALALIDREGNIHAEGLVDMKEYKEKSFDDYLQALVSEIGRMTRAVPGSELAGIGIGAPMANYYKGTIEYAGNLPWKGVVLPVVEKMHKFFPETPIKITNDANAAAIGEMIYGGAKGMKDFIVVTLGSGLGSGFVAGGQLIYGSDGFAGELGHITVMRPGRQCGCGKRGCLETYVSATGIRRTIFELLAEFNPPKPTEESVFHRTSYASLKTEMITEAAEKGDPIALEAYEFTGKMLGQALADMVTITTPEAIFLFGGLANAGKFIFEPTKKHMEENLLTISKGKVPILPSGVDEGNAAVLGASALIWQEIG